MKRTPNGTSVGVERPYDHVDRCDHLTDDGRCRFAVERFEDDPVFARRRRDDDYRCPVVTPDDEWEWPDCPNFRSTSNMQACARCGLEERPAPGQQRPLLEEHHLSYRRESTAHEITIALCRWCHANVHDSWAAVDDEVTPAPEALAAREQRRSREQTELDFETAAERYDTEN